MSAAYCWQRRHVESRDDTVATIAALNAKCHAVLEAGIGAVARTDEGRRELHLLAYHTEKISCCLKAALATPFD